MVATSSLQGRHRGQTSVRRTNQRRVHFDKSEHKWTVARLGRCSLRQEWTQVNIILYIHFTTLIKDSLDSQLWIQRFDWIYQILSIVAWHITYHCPTVQPDPSANINLVQGLSLGNPSYTNPIGVQLVTRSQLLFGRSPWTTGNN